jgi:phosphatidylserine/phosphatidylglycerophosphate/cardiolipin synthase-like enzyme
MVMPMTNQIVFISLAIIAGLVVGVGVGYLINNNQVNSLNAENAGLRYQVQVLQQNLTSYNASYQTLKTLYDATKNSYQSLSLQYSNLNLAYNSAMSNLRTLNGSYNTMAALYSQLIVSQTNLLKSYYNTTFLPNGTYYTNALSTLENANSSIYVVMYEMKYDPGDSNDTANDLIAALAAARGRGVDVRVVLDDETLNAFPDTIAYLQNNTVPFRLDPSNSTDTHAKLVLVDGETVLIGSDNWTESGLSYNNEFAVMLTGNMTTVTSYFLNLWNNGRTL